MNTIKTIAETIALYALVIIVGGLVWIASLREDLPDPEDWA